MNMETFKAIVRSLCPPLIWRGMGRLRRGLGSQSASQETEIARLRHVRDATPMEGAILRCRTRFATIATTYSFCVLTDQCLASFHEILT